MTQTKTSKKKKVVKTTKKKVTPTSQRVRKSSSAKEPKELIFKKENYILMGAGAGLIFLGMLLMSGGSMPSPDVWDDSIIYSFRRTVLAPVVILAGLVVEIFAIFKRA
ncbi:MAG: DUF3098 domain-containing protein [Saprospiraceae bacterium]|nr:DUF3098 domain-containing protein [Saprospiraceae bacterium]